jgi:hypothetical protein
MLTRMRLVKGATALLYIGPLIAGLCGFGWDMVAPFTAIFVVWLMVLRPEQWPASPAEWMTGQAWLAALTQVLSQILLVGVLFGVGRGLGGLADVGTVAVNPMLPLSISFVSIPLCRMLWDAEEAASQGYFLDEEAALAYADSAVAQAAKAVIPLLNLPDTAPDDEAARAVATALDVPAAELRLNAATAALANPDRSHTALRRALLLWATEPEIVAHGHVPGSMANAFSIAGGNFDLLRLYVPRAMALIAAFPGRAADFPEPDLLLAAAEAEAPANSDLPAHLQDDLRYGLRALARSVHAALGSGPIPVTKAEPAAIRPRSERTA